MGAIPDRRPFWSFIHSSCGQHLWDFSLALKRLVSRPSSRPHFLCLSPGLQGRVSRKRCQWWWEHNLGLSGDSHRLHIHNQLKVHPKVGALHYNVMHLCSWPHCNRLTTNYFMMMMMMKGSVKNRICSTTTKLRKSPVKPVTRQKTCNYIELCQKMARIIPCCLEPGRGQHNISRITPMHAFHHKQYEQNKYTQPVSMTYSQLLAKLTGKAHFWIKETFFFIKKFQQPRTF